MATDAPRTIPKTSVTGSRNVILRNALVLLFATAFAAVVGEFALRALYKDQTVLFPRYHTDYRYGRYTLRGIRPNTEFWHTSVDGSWQFITNSRGFRNNRDFTYDKPTDTIRVLSLGDSHTQGYEVRQEATFSAVLEQGLASNGERAEVLNAGVSGFSTAEEVAFLEAEGHKYQPDVVILGFYANDFADNLKAGLFALGDNGRLQQRKYEHIPGVRVQNVIYRIPSVEWLSEHSYFYSMLFNSTWAYFKARLRERTARTGSPEEQLEDEFEYAVATPASQTEYKVALAVALVERMQQFCQSHGIRLIVVDIPGGSQTERFVSSLPPEMRSRLRAADVEYVPSELLLEGVDDTVRIHVPHGAHHISEFTHRLIGDELARRIVAGTIPAKDRQH
jgi:GDSL-like Lipase/Acylhydrolase family